MNQYIGEFFGMFVPVGYFQNRSSTTFVSNKPFKNYRWPRTTWYKKSETNANRAFRLSVLNLEIDWHIHSFKMTYFERFPRDGQLTEIIPWHQKPINSVLKQKVKQLNIKRESIDILKLCWSKKHADFVQNWQFSMNSRKNDHFR